MARKTRSKPQPTMESFIFEINDFEASYSLSVNPRRHEPGPWWEHSHIALSTVCIFPKKFVGRPTAIDLVADRDFWTPYSSQRDPDWRPLCVGLLELPPTAGRFYAFFPYDGLATVLTAITHRLFRFIHLYGPPLSRGKSLCRSMDFKLTIDLDDY